MAEARVAIVDLLNGLISTELTATNQYFVHAKLCQHWGYERLAHRFRESSMEEMRDIEELMDRVLQLGGIPNLQRQHPFSVGERVVEQLQLSQTLESGAVDQLREGIANCQGTGDTVTEDMLRKMLTEEEEQLNWLDAQIALLESLGE